MDLSRCHVPAGTFHISNKAPLLLQAYLGTCVGLSLYCKTSGVGGIIHFLLPEPVSVLNATHLEKYASTGVPLFIQAMLKAGAQKDTLTACMAGGALVGPLSRHDLDLDIGGRMVEKVRELLKAESIEIDHSETGGFFTCCLSLNLTDGKCTIEPAGYTKLSETADIRTPSAAEIKLAMDHLKPIPQVALKVMRMVDEPEYTVDAVADEIRKDQVITARVLMLANSAIFGSKKNIETLDHALVYLGQNMLIKLVISAAVQSYYGQAAMGYSLCKGGLYYHAIGCAQVAESLAVRTGKVDPGKAYTAGLLHDIGKVVLDQYIASAYPLFYRKVIEEGESVIATEKRLFGIDHTEVGHILSLQWSFPQSLVQVIRYHHFPEKITGDKELAMIVHLADLLLSRFNIGIEFERLDTGALNKHFGALNLISSDLAQLVDIIPTAVFRSGAEDPLSLY